MILRSAVSAEEISAFVDGELEGERAAEIERALNENAALGEYAAALRGDKARLTEIYGSFAERPLPAAWRARIEDYERPWYARASYRTMGAIAATLLVAAGLVGVWREQMGSQQQDIVDLALRARSGGIRAEAVIETGMLDVANRAISQALQMPRRAPDLSRLGYKLASVQVFAGASGDKPVELVYQDARNRSFTLYIRRPVGAPRTEMLDRGGVRTCVWQYDDLGAVMAGKMSWPEMMRIAASAYSVFTRRSAA